MGPLGWISEKNRKKLTMIAIFSINYKQEIILWYFQANGLEMIDQKTAKWFSIEMSAEFRRLFSSMILQIVVFIMNSS